MTDQMQDALQSLLDTGPERPVWLVSLLDQSMIGSYFNLSPVEVAWLMGMARSLFDRDIRYLPVSNFILSECDQHNYYLLNSGICNPSY